MKNVYLKFVCKGANAIKTNTELLLAQLRSKSDYSKTTLGSREPENLIQRIKSRSTLKKYSTILSSLYSLTESTSSKD